METNEQDLVAESKAKADAISTELLVTLRQVIPELEDLLKVAGLVGRLEAAVWLHGLETGIYKERSEA